MAPANSTSDNNSSKSITRLIEIGIALSVERNINRLMEKILSEAMDICNADGGTLYLRTEDGKLKFEIMRTVSKGISMGGTTGKDIPFPPLNMYDPKTGAANHKNVASHVAITGESVNIPDVYQTDDFDFSGTKKFDEGNNYKSKSFLTVPLKNHQGEVIGVLQLLNAQETATNKSIPFSSDIQPLIEALSSQAAVALDNQLLLAAQKDLLDSFIELLAGTIDAKSPYTGGHCQRVPVLAIMLADAACESSQAPFTDFAFTDEERHEMHISALLHDCGKVITPEYIVDKATKLETINDRIHEIRTRFEVLKRDTEIAYLEALIEGKDDQKILRQKRDDRLKQLDDDFIFIAQTNIGGEFMAPDKVERVKNIAKIKWSRTLDDRLGVSHEELKRKERSAQQKLPAEENLLDDKEEHIFYRKPDERYGKNNKYGFKLDVPEYEYNRGEVCNLCVPRGTLTPEDHFKIKDHIMQTIMMLDQLTFPKNLKRVPEYAGAHHETMIGTGYPKKLGKKDMTIPARIMAIADIFEALTAADRPYKKAKKLSESIKILSFMKKDEHIDADLFELFLKSGIYKKYAAKFLKAEQVDEVDISQYLD